MSITVFPFDYDETKENPSEYTAEQMAEVINGFVTDGIVPDDDGKLGSSFLVSSVNSNTIKIEKGTAIVNKRMFILHTNINLSVENGEFDVVLQISLPNSTGKVMLKTSIGEISENLSRSDVQYELGIASITKTDTEISIIDHRLNKTLTSNGKEVCYKSRVKHDNGFLEAWAELGNVRTVNGVSPDENYDISLPIGNVFCGANGTKYLVQTGVFVSEENNGTITFPIAYKTIPAVFVTPDYGDDTRTTNYLIISTSCNVTKTSFKTYKDDTILMKNNWLAIGEID